LVTETTAPSIGRTLRDDDVRGYQHRIDSALGPRAMGALARNTDVEEPAARHHRSGAHREFSECQPRPVVHAEHHVAGKFLEQSVCDHRARPADAFLGWLEDEVDHAVEVARVGEIFRRAEQHGGMAVMPAGVHAPIVRRTVRESIRLVNRQRVHVGAQTD
jgi:hypothetical protein